MSIAQACILGFVHGLTQFLPISSSAHMVFFPWLLRWQTPSLAFEVFLQLGAMVATLGYFARDWLGILKGGITSIIDRRIGFDRERLLFWLVVFGSLPTILVVLFLQDEATRLFRDPVLIAIPLTLLGLFLYWIDGKYAALRTLDELNGKDAIFVGLAQTFAVIPGVSRSGACITMARLMGMNRDASARYAYLLSFPVLLCSSLFKWRMLSDQVGVTVALPPLIAGFLCSLVFGLVSIHVLLRFVREVDFAVFAWYRVFLGALVILWSVYKG